LPDAKPGLSYALQGVFGRVMRQQCDIAIGKAAEAAGLQKTVKQDGAGLWLLLPCFACCPILPVLFILSAVFLKQ
jgi:hypothetical protein